MFDFEEKRPLEGLIRFTQMTFIALIGGLLAGCASINSGEKGPASESNPCAESLSFYAQNSQRTRYSTCEQEACGVPVDPNDVLVIEIENGESVDLAVESRVGTRARYMDQWYLAGPFFTSKSLDKPKRILAAMGCNLLIVGDTEWKRTRIDESVRRDQMTQIRWGNYW